MKVMIERKMRNEKSGDVIEGRASREIDRREREIKKER